MKYKILIMTSCLLIIFDELKAPFFEGWGARNNTTVKAENDVRNNVRLAEVSRSEVKVPVEVRASERVDVNKIDVDRFVRERSKLIQDMVDNVIRMDTQFKNNKQGIEYLKETLVDSTASSLNWSEQDVALIKQYLKQGPSFEFDASQGSMSLKRQVSSWISDFIQWAINLLSGKRKSGRLGEKASELDLAAQETNSLINKLELLKSENLALKQNEIQPVEKVIELSTDVVSQPEVSQNVEMTDQEKIAALKQELKDAGIGKLILGGPNANGTVINSVIAKYFKDGLPKDVSRASLFEANLDSSGFLSGIGNNINLNKVEGLNVEQKSAKSLQSSNPIVQNSINKLTQSVLTQKNLNKLSLSSIESFKEQGAKIIADELVSDATKLIVRKNLGLLEAIDMSALKARQQAAFDNLSSNSLMVKNSNEARVKKQIEVQVEADFNAKKSDIEQSLTEQFGELSPELMQEHLDVEKEMMLDAAYEIEGNKALIAEAQQKDEDQLKASVAVSKRKVSTSTTSPEQLKVSQRNKQVRDIQTSAIKKAQNEIAEQVQADFAKNEQAAWDNAYYATHAKARNSKNKIAVADMNRARTAHVQTEIDAVLEANKNKMTQVRENALGQEKFNRSVKAVQQGASTMKAYNQAVSPDVFMTAAQRKTAMKKMNYDLSGKNPDMAGMTKQELLTYLLKQSPEGESASAKTSWSNEIAVLQESIAADVKIATSPEGVVAESGGRVLKNIKNNVAQSGDQSAEQSVDVPSTHLSRLKPVVRNVSADAVNNKPSWVGGVQLKSVKNDATENVTQSEDSSTKQNEDPISKLRKVSKSSSTMAILTNEQSALQ